MRDLTACARSRLPARPRPVATPEPLLTHDGRSLRIAVTGAGGRLDGQVVRILASEPAHDVVAVSRRAPPTEPDLAHICVRIADYEDPAALAAAPKGVETHVFVSCDGPTAQVVVHHQNVIRAAAASGVGHLVALSGLDADPESPFCYGSVMATQSGRWIATTTSPGQSHWISRPSRRSPPRVGQAGQLHRADAQGLPRRVGALRRGALVAIRLLHDVRLDPPKALDGGFR